MAPCPECGTEVKTRFCTECGLPNKAMIEQAARGGFESKIVFERSLYPWCIFSCIFCCSEHLTVSQTRIDTETGCCRGNMDSIDVRRIKDISFDRGCCQMLLGRGTVTILSADETDPELTISTWSAKKLYSDIKRVWNASKMGTTVE
eukprot:m.478690 g.478690  ORF g.478690 m.478690 type:complete len:147 (+) comp21199_c0_seq1:218-658(+)